MICPTCRAAADDQLPADQHCDDPGCMCGHRVWKSRPANGYDLLADFYDRFARLVDQTTEAHRRETVIPIGDAFTFATPNDRTED